jgi:hypothetical protein
MCLRVIIVPNKPLSHPVRCAYLHGYVDMHVSILRDHPQYIKVMKSFLLLKLAVL